MLWWQHQDTLEVHETYDGSPVIMTWRDHLGVSWLAYFHDIDHGQASLTYIVKSTTPERLEAFMDGLVLCRDMVTESCSGSIYLITCTWGEERDEALYFVETLTTAQARELDALPDPYVYTTHYEEPPS